MFCFLWGRAPLGYQMARSPVKQMQREGKVWRHNNRCFSDAALLYSSTNGLKKLAGADHWHCTLSNTMHPYIALLEGALGTFPAALHIFHLEVAGKHQGKLIPKKFPFFRLTKKFLWWWGKLHNQHESVLCPNSVTRTLQLKKYTWLLLCNKASVRTGAIVTSKLGWPSLANKLRLSLVVRGAKSSRKSHFYDCAPTEATAQLCMGTYLCTASFPLIKDHKDGINGRICLLFYACPSSLVIITTPLTSTEKRTLCVWHTDVSIQLSSFFFIFLFNCRPTATGGNRFWKNNGHTCDIGPLSVC